MLKYANSVPNDNAQRQGGRGKRVRVNELEREQEGRRESEWAREGGRRQERK